MKLNILCGSRGSCASASWPRIIFEAVFVKSKQPQDRVFVNNYWDQSESLDFIELQLPLRRHVIERIWRNDFLSFRSAVWRLIEDQWLIQTNEQQFFSHQLQSTKPQGIRDRAASAVYAGWPRNSDFGLQNDTNIELWLRCWSLWSVYTTFNEFVKLFRCFWLHGFGHIRKTRFCVELPCRYCTAVCSHSVKLPNIYLQVLSLFANSSIPVVPDRYTAAVAVTSWTEVKFNDH